MKRDDAFLNSWQARLASAPDEGPDHADPARVVHHYRTLWISDLHLGKRVNEFSMLEEQKYILQQY